MGREMYVPKDIVKLILSYCETHREALTRKFNAIWQIFIKFNHSLIPKPNNLKTNWDKEFGFTHGEYVFETRITCKTEYRAYGTRIKPKTVRMRFRKGYHVITEGILSTWNFKVMMRNIAQYLNLDELC